ncbi:unnamed protein product, partial [Prorocentrum cordatum]
DRLCGVRVLDLGACASDEALARLWGRLPALEELGCVGSPGLSDAGLAHLAGPAPGGADAGAHGCRAALRRVDITCCPGTSYGAAVALRRRLPGLELVRRLPAWLEGRFLTPFGGDGPEVHTYYADGAFEFTRSVQSRGYVRYLRHSDDGSFMKDSLQYSNFVGEWPLWAKFFYCPGVSVKYPAEPSPGAVRSVLVAQALGEVEAPEAWPAVPDEGVPLGGSVMVREDGSHMPLGTGVSDAAAQGAVAMVSRMEVLAPERSMPPEDLVAEIEAFERERREFETQQEHLLPFLEDHMRRLLRST